MTRRAATSATRSIRARTCSTASPSRCSSTASSGHTRCRIHYDPSHFVLQQLDYLAFIDIYHERIKAFHVKDAEFNPTGRQGVYRGYQRWINRAGRFRSLGDGQVDFAGIFSKLAQYGYRLLGGAGMGMLPEAPRGRRARGRAVHRRATSSASPKRPSTTSPAAAPTASKSARCSACADRQSEPGLRQTSGRTTWFPHRK